MSYSSELKKELLSEIPEKRDVQLGEAAGIILGLAKFEFLPERINFTVRTESPVLARYFFKLIQRLYDKKADLSYEQSSRFHKHRTYILAYEDAEQILRESGAMVKHNGYFISPILGGIYYQEERVRRAFLRGLFLATGSVINPERSYHLEIDMADNALTETVSEVLEDYDIEAHIVPKKGKSILYLKDSQAISDFLALIGANKAVLNLEDIKVLKQMRGKVNREVNCETANMKKSVRAANEQIEAIDFLEQSGVYQTLDPELRSVASLRKDHPQASIARLAEKHNPPISRATMHRKLKRLVDLARQEKENAQSETNP